MSESSALIVKLLLMGLVAYMALLLIVFVFQRKLLYLPSRDPLPVVQARRLGLQHWPSVEAFRGFTSLSEPESPRGTVVIFHGNAGAAYNRHFYIEPLASLGLRVILAEYPGYGGRPGVPAEDVLVQDALDTLQIAHQRYGEPLYLWGESLGCGVAAGVVRHSNVPLAGLTLFLAWDSLPQIAQTHYWFLPARWLTRDTYHNIDNLRGYQGNVAVILAGDDEVIPLRNSKALYDAIDTSKRLWLFEGATHNALPIAPHLPWWREVVEFITR